MGKKINAKYNVDNGTDFDTMHFETNAGMVEYEKADGKMGNVQNELDELNSNLQREIVGYSTSRIWQAPKEIQNATSGKIEFISRNGVATIRVTNLKCKPDTGLLEFSGYVGENFYLYDQDNTGFYIDRSILYCNKAETGFATLTFVFD